MIGHSGLLDLGERFVWWLFQLTKRDVAIFFFLILALLDLGIWIIHVWTIVAGVSLIISAVATARRANGRSDAIAPSRDDVARRAFELYCGRGCQDGYDVQDWLQAERELRRTTSTAA